ncbi:phenylacetate--CoA ligase family protein [Pseudonocardia dioxanivorans]|uniref:phenylacetate--CoA ligase family protein n=1 Tax=Pseudonocardia dioxanivorans TaxID=240495 RepID=UPI00104A7EF2|nr:AMP-binding protein [Pseudonocardia dioxanivorans]
MTRAAVSCAPVESLGPEELLVLQRTRFATQWLHLWDDSAFYRRKLRAAGFSRERVPDLADLRDVPFTEKTEIRASQDAAPPLGEHLAVEPTAVRQVQMSSGTSGRPSMVPLTAADAADWAEIIRRGYVAVGFTPDDMIVHGFGMSRGWSGGLPMVEGILALGATVLPLGAEAGSDRILNAMEMLRPTGLQGSPGFLHALGSRAQERGLDPSGLGVRAILTGGEPGGGIPSVRNALQEMWGARVCEVMGGSDIVVLMWAECPNQDGMHFVAPDVVHAEIIDPVTEQPLPIEAGTQGELVYTHLTREAAPLLRFKHRDLVSVLGTGPCSCGRRTPRIRCDGRSDDMLIVKGVNLFPSAVQEVLAEAVGPSPVFRIRRPRGQYVLPGPVELRVEATDREDGRRAAVEKALHDALACRFAVTLVEPGALAVPGATKAVFFEEV